MKNCDRCGDKFPNLEPVVCEYGGVHHECEDCAIATRAEVDALS